MAFRNKFIHSLLACLLCAALLSGCANGRGRRIRLPQCHWPQSWARPSWVPDAAGPPMPVPADPSGSPYSPQSPRGLYVPSGPAPESKLGLPVPPPLQPAVEDPAPQPEPQTEALPPAAEDLDVSFQNQPARRPAVVPAPPPEEREEMAPQVAERVDPYDRHRQPVNLGVPELNSQLDAGAVEMVPEPSVLRRSPVDAFPQSRQPSNTPDRGAGHSPPFDDSEIEESDDEPLPDSLDSNRRQPQSSLQESLPELSEPADSDLSFPGVHRQTSAERTSKSHRVERLNSNLSVQNFHLTRDARTGRGSEVISARALKRGQNVAVQAELVGLKQVSRNGEMITNLTYHCEIRDARNHVLLSTKGGTSTEASKSPESYRQLLTWVAIPANLKVGDHVLQVHLKDNLSGRNTLIEMPITVK